MISLCKIFHSIVVTVALIFSTMAMGGCKDSIPISTSDSPEFSLNHEIETPTANILVNEELSSSQEINQLTQILLDFGKRIKERQISKEALQDAYESGNKKRVYSLLGYSQEDINRIKLLLSTNKDLIKMQYSDQLIANTCSDKSNTNIIVNFFNHYDAYINMIEKKFSENTQATECSSWIGYTACLIVCTSLEPWLYFICAAGCACGFDCYECF